MGAPVAEEDEAELLAFVLRERAREVSPSENRVTVRSFFERGLFERYRELRRQVVPPLDPPLDDVLAEWRASPEWLQVHTELSALCDDPEVVDDLMRVKVSLGILWIVGGKKEPLDAKRTARVIFNQRNLGLDLHEELVWAPLRDQLEGRREQGA